MNIFSPICKLIIINDEFYCLYEIETYLFKPGACRHRLPVLVYASVRECLYRAITGDITDAVFNQKCVAKKCGICIVSHTKLGVIRSYLIFTTFAVLIWLLNSQKPMVTENMMVNIEWMVLQRRIFG